MDRSPPNIIIKALLDQDSTPNRLCPVDSLHCWLALSDPWGIDAIFANPKSHKKMNRGAVSQLLVTTINRSQPGVLAKAHDVRKVSATFAWARGVPPPSNYTNYVLEIHQRIHTWCLSRPAPETFSTTVIISLCAS